MESANPRMIKCKFCGEDLLQIWDETMYAVCADAYYKSLEYGEDD